MLIQSNLMGFRRRGLLPLGGTSSFEFKVATSTLRHETSAFRAANIFALNLVSFQH